MVAAGGAQDRAKALVVYDRQGSSFWSAAPGMFPWKDIFGKTSVFHCSGITCAVSQSAADATFEAVRTAREMGLRNQLSTNHHILSALLWYDGTIYKTRIHDINDIVDSVGVGDAFVAASMLKNSIVGDFNLVTEEEILSATS